MRRRHPGSCATGLRSSEWPSTCWSCGRPRWTRRAPRLQGVRSYLWLALAQTLVCHWTLPGPGHTLSAPFLVIGKGLLIGQPEHDWHSVQNKYFYNNNLWQARGMRVLGMFLSASGNATLGSQLTQGAEALSEAIAASVALVSVPVAGGNPAVFLPPYAQPGMTPYTSMTSGREASYANFRFYSESLLADALPREVEASFLAYHNHHVGLSQSAFLPPVFRHNTESGNSFPVRCFWAGCLLWLTYALPPFPHLQGGRAGGASRFEGWLDDMPTAGWGYGALANNHTADFQALLYGHAATYQSRGTFHSTEQLQWEGEGWYRDFLHWPNPSPNSTGPNDPQPSPASLGYYANENDISFCVVSEILIARMTRWQLVFDDYHRDPTPSLWLARGAPKRWFSPAAAAFGVQNAPTYHGHVTFNVTTTAPGSSTYNVSPPQNPSTTGPVVFRLRWPGPLTADPVLCTLTSLHAACWVVPSPLACSVGMPTASLRLSTVLHPCSLSSLAPSFRCGGPKPAARCSMSITQRAWQPCRQRLGARCLVSPPLSWLDAMRARQPLKATFFVL